jgi:ribosomal protein S18 acetylase RimI-like enzyme
MTETSFEIIPFQSEHQPFFDQLNRQWIEKYFRIEAPDEVVLKHPREAILDTGGSIFMARRNGEIEGTVALLKIDEESFQLAKMAVKEDSRGKGMGAALARSAILRARLDGAKRIILYSNRTLEAALHLYRKLGFREIPLERPLYSRGNIMMELLLPQISVRKAGPKDAAAIAEIGVLAFREAFTREFSRPEDLENYLAHTYSEEKIEAGLYKPNNRFFLANYGDQFAGFAKIKIQSSRDQFRHTRQTELQKIYVPKKYQHIGTGSLLMGTVLQSAREWHPGIIWLDVLINNSRAIRFYESFGFMHAGEHSFVIGSQTLYYSIMALETTHAGPDPG